MLGAGRRLAQEPGDAPFVRPDLGEGAFSRAPCKGSAGKPAQAGGVLGEKDETLKCLRFCFCFC